VESGQSSLGALVALLEAVDAGALVRVAFGTRRHDMRYVDAIVAPPGVPAGWQPKRWEYEDVTFVAASVSSRALAAALSRDDAQVLPLGGYDLTLPVLSEHVQWWHKPSRARWESVLLPWPIRDYDLSMPGGPQQVHVPGYMIGDDCPSFPTYGAAFRAFFYGEFAGVGGQVPSGFGTVRLVQSAAWLDRVLITPTALQVGVAGSSAAGMRIELNSATYQVDRRVGETGTVILPLPDGLPDGAWLYLTQNRQWLDYRAIGEYRAPGDLARAGVEVQAPEDPDTEIQALISQGEGLRVEFKRQLPEDSVDAKRTIFKTVAAFANGYGGSIVFGVEKDEATVCGLDGIDPIRERDRLMQLVRAIVTPAPETEARQYNLAGQTLLVLSVEPGTDPPYGITLPGRKDKPVEFYVRRDATTFPARPEEIRNAVLATAPAPSVPGPSWLGG
jgi:Putative DNA-binding domain